jgi:hypothetical protein
MRTITHGVAARRARSLPGRTPNRHPRRVIPSARPPFSLPTSCDIGTIGRMQAMESIANTTKSLENTAAEPITAPALAAEPPLPRRFERYTLLKRLARGGMGEVLLASSGGIEGAERPVVVKIIRREHETDRSFLARFLDEARIQAQLHHPGVASRL